MAGPIAPQPISVTNGLEALAVSSSSGTAVWVHNQGDSAVSGESFTLSELAAPSYDVSAFDPWSGQWGAVQTHAASAGQITVFLPTLAGDADLAYFVSPL